MIRITDAQYAEIARDVLSFAQDSGVETFFNLRFGADKKLILSAVVYRDDNDNVERIVSVWAEYNPGDTPNDFRWSELYKHFGFIK